VLVYLKINSQVFLEIRDHFLYFVLGQVKLVIRDLDLASVRGLILLRGSDGKNPIDIYIVHNFYEDLAFGDGVDAREVETSKPVILLHFGVISLVYTDRDNSLIVFMGSEIFGFSARELGVTIDHGIHDTAVGFNTEGHWQYIDQHYVLDLVVPDTSKSSSPDGSSCDYSFIGVNASVEFFASEELRNELSEFGNPS